MQTANDFATDLLSVGDLYMGVKPIQWISDHFSVSYTQCKDNQMKYETNFKIIWTLICQILKQIFDIKFLLFPDGVVASRVVVGRILLAGDQLRRVEQLLVGSWK